MIWDPASERALRIAIASTLIVSCARATNEVPLRLYDMTTETGMPHLEENLRYSTTRENRCLAEGELWFAFPVLHHPALQDCRLDQRSRRRDALSFALVCDGGKGTTGTATWQLGTAQLTGTLEIKLGGKNMTFYQRVTVKPLTECAASESPSTRRLAPN